MSIESVMPPIHLIHCHPFSSCPQSFAESGSFPVSQLFISDGQSIGATTSVSVLLMNIQGCFPLGLTGSISLLSKGLSRVFCSTTMWKNQFFGTQPSMRSTCTASQSQSWNGNDSKKTGDLSLSEQKAKFSVLHPHHLILPLSTLHEMSEVLVPTLFSGCTTQHVGS